MGAYLAVGLNFEIDIAKNDVAKAGWSESKLLDELEKELFIDASNYELASNEDSLVYRLRTDTLAKLLIPLLEKVYPLLYPRQNHWQRVIHELSATPPENWLDWAEESEHDSFYMDGDWDEFAIGAHPDKVYGSLSNIRLMMEGKFYMEESSKSFHFLQYCISNSFPENSLCRSLRIYILG